jgi:hypothetical protein
VNKLKLKPTYQIVKAYYAELGILVQLRRKRPGFANPCPASETSLDKAFDGLRMVILTSHLSSNGYIMPE